MNDTVDKWNCSGCHRVIREEAEYVDNGGVCDDCYSKHIKRRLGKVIIWNE